MQLTRILVPIGLPHEAPRLLQQAAYLARHFSSEIIVLHVLTPLHYPAGVLESGHALSEQDLHAKAVETARARLEQAVRAHLDGLSVRQLLVRGEIANEIARTASAERAELVMMSMHRLGGFLNLLSGIVTAKVLHKSDCPLWTDAEQDDGSSGAFAIRRVLCSVDLSAHSRHTLRRAALIAAQFSAQLTLVHVIAGTTIFAPGGKAELTDMKRELTAGAAQEIDTLQRDCGTSAEVIIESGDVLSALRAAAARSGSDLLVIGRLPPGGHIGDNGSGFAIMREAAIPVMSV